MSILNIFIIYLAFSNLSLVKGDCSANNTNIYNFNCMIWADTPLADGTCNCDSCESGKILQTSGIHKTCVEATTKLKNYLNCLQGTKTTQDGEDSYACTSCMTGYTLANSACVLRTSSGNQEKLKNCVTATGTNGAYTCTKCDDTKYAIVSGTCTDLTETDDKGCSKATPSDNGYACSECKTGYALIDQLNCYSYSEYPQFDGCSSGESESEDGCTKCATGYARMYHPDGYQDYNVNYLCVSTENYPKLANCENANSLTQCDDCKDNYYVDENTGICTNVCPPELDALHCATCASLDSCNTCKTGYYLSGSTCVEECDTYRQDEHWKTCSATDTGKECEDGYYANDTQCIEKCDESLLNENWATCSKYQKGKECKDGYYSMNGDECIDDCQSDYLSTDRYCKKCSKKDTCKECQDGSWRTKIKRTSSTFTCTKESDISDKTYLANCVFLRRENTSVPYYCLRCEEGYYPYQGQCKAEPLDKGSSSKKSISIALLSLIILILS